MQPAWRESGKKEWKEEKETIKGRFIVLHRLDTQRIDLSAKAHHD